MFETDLVTYLKKDATLNALIGGRIYPSILPEKGTLPAVAFFEVSNTGHHDIDVLFPRYQFSCFSKRAIEAKQVRQEIKDILQRFKGAMGNTKIIQGVVEGEYTTHEDDTNLFNAIIDIKFIMRSE